MPDNLIVGFARSRQDADSIEATWTTVDCRKVLICLDEGNFPTGEAKERTDAVVEQVGIRTLDINAARLIDDAYELTEKLFPMAGDSWKHRCDGWMAYPLRYFVLYVLHSLRIISEVQKRFAPRMMLLPERLPYSVRIEPQLDHENSSPLFFDLLQAWCDMNQVAVGNRHSFGCARLKRSFTWGKHIFGTWSKTLRPIRRRPERVEADIVIANLGVDFHRQFDWSSFDTITGRCVAWIRGREVLVDARDLFRKQGNPQSFQLGTLSNCAKINGTICQADTSIRPFSVLSYWKDTLLSNSPSQSALRQIDMAYNFPISGIFGYSLLPPIHAECYLASALYCRLEYERARSVLRQTSPRLFVVGNHFTSLPQVAAARDLGIKTLGTQPGVEFYEDHLFLPNERNGDGTVRLTPDTICAFGKHGKGRWSSRTESNVTIAQDAFSWSDTPRSVLGSQRLALFITSARANGWWYDSLLYDYQQLRSGFRRIMETMRGSGIKVLLKSHPVCDLYTFYDEMATEYPDVIVRHQRTPLTNDEICTFHAAVMLGGASTLMAQVIQSGVPLLYFSGGLTDAGRNEFCFRGLRHTQDEQELVDALRQVASNGPARDSAVRKGTEMLDHYVSPLRRSFASVVDELIGQSPCP